MILAQVLKERLDERVVRLGEHLSIKSRHLVEGRDHARKLTEMIKKNGDNPNHADILVTTRRELLYPKRQLYGEAVNALFTTMSSSSSVTNRLKSSIFNMIETRGRQSNSLQPGGMFTFYAIERRELICSSLSHIDTNSWRNRHTPSVWDYLCHSLAEPEEFENKEFVAVTDRVGRLPEEYTDAPCVSVNRQRIVLDSVPVQRPGGPLYYMVVRELLVQ